MRNGMVRGLNDVFALSLFLGLLATPLAAQEQPRTVAKDSFRIAGYLPEYHASEFEPSAADCSPFAVECEPTAVESVPIACAVSPPAKELSPSAKAFEPTADDCSPLATEA